MFEETKVVISERAYADIINETFQNIRTETGGILLGIQSDRAWYVVESLDPGPRAILRSAYFEYDDKYVTHLANKVRLRYRAKLRLLGLWHRHPGSLDRFSSTDDETNRTYVRTCGGSAISGLVNIDPTFRMTFYVATGDPLRYDRIRVEVGDHNMPSQMLRVWDSRGLLQSLASLASESIAGQIPSNRLGNKPVGPIIAAPDRSLFDRLFRPIKPWRRAHTYLTNQQEVGGGDRVELSDCGKQSAVLDSIDQELAYLDRQQDYSYELSLQDGGVRVVLTRAMQIRECPSRLEFLFLIVDGRLSVCWGDQRYDYAPGITNTLVNKALGMFN